MSKPNRPPGDGGTGKGGGGPNGEVVRFAPRAASPVGRAVRGARPPKERAWAEVASFVINFECRAPDPSGHAERRITAHKMQDGGITAEWTGLAQQPMVAWIADHVGDWDGVQAVQSAAPAAENKIDSKPMLRDISAIAVSITAVKARQACGPAMAASTGVLDKGRAVVLQSRDTFELDAVIDISGLDDHESRPACAPCAVQFFSRNTVTQERSRLGEALAVAPITGRSSFLATLPQVSLPAGTYRVASVATLKGTPPKLAYAEGPLLEIV